MRLNDETTWPVEVLDYLEQHEDLFRGWELRRAGNAIASVSGAEYDDAIRGLRVVLGNHTLHGYHCARLTDAEMNQITSSGMGLPNGTTLHQRIQTILNSGLIEPHIADRLRRENQADESNRVGRIWFCFFPPHIAGQRAIERLLRSWGGEALYNTHEDDPVTGPVLKSIGKPCLVEADVPIASLEIHSSLDDKVARQFLINRGLETGEPVNHEDRAKWPISATHIRRIIQFPEDDFITLTKCNTWKPSLKCC
jgi:hypothetical protein